MLVNGCSFSNTTDAGASVAFKFAGVDHFEVSDNVFKDFPVCETSLHSGLRPILTAVLRLQGQPLSVTIFITASRMTRLMARIGIHQRWIVDSQKFVSEPGRTPYP
jgi:hypothetical protein